MLSAAWPGAQNDVTKITFNSEASGQCSHDLVPPLVWFRCGCRCGTIRGTIRGLWFRCGCRCGTIRGTIRDCPCGCRCGNLDASTRMGNLLSLHP